jgi:hypothetical protein
LHKSAFKFWVFTLALPLTLSSQPAFAAVKVLPSKPAITAVSPLGSGDQISDLAISASSVAVVGTVEKGLLDLVTTPTLGGSDGFISALDKSKKLIWSLRLGSSGDDIATAIARDQDGSFWVVGATAKPLETSTAVIDNSAVNLDSVTVKSAVTPRNSLNRLALWKIGTTGQLSQTFFYDAAGVIVPTAITTSGTSVNIVGNLTQGVVTQQFSISANATGVFSGLRLGKIPVPKAAAIETIKAGPNKITSFISKTTIIDIPSWRAKRPTPVIVKYTNKGKALAANSLPGKVKKVLWQSGIGTAVLVEVNSENQIHLLTNMA